MIVSGDPSRLPASDKAALLYAQARGDVSARLWRAALGTNDTTEAQAETASACPDFDLDALLSLLTPTTTAHTPPHPVGLAGLSSQDLPEETGALPDPMHSTRGPATGLGPNDRYSGALNAAAARTGIPAAALAAIVNAEAAKNCDGSWKTGSRNPRSSAAGLGQFLGGTWQGEAERAGTWLHDVATRQGWLGDTGRVLPAARSALLALRYDAAASINATADYALRSVTQLKHAGVAVGEDVANVAKVAYLGHHLGTGDAIRFLRGGLDSRRAKLLLDAQVGAASANQRIAHSGDAATAHRSWLLNYIERNVTPSRFATEGLALAGKSVPAERADI